MTRLAPPSTQVPGKAGSPSVRAFRPAAAMQRPAPPQFEGVQDTLARYKAAAAAAGIQQAAPTLSAGSGSSEPRGMYRPAAVPTGRAPLSKIEPGQANQTPDAMHSLQQVVARLEQAVADEQHRRLQLEQKLAEQDLSIDQLVNLANDMFTRQEELARAVGR
eukprot:SAG22_NODE_4483_length_1255_cov_2.861592_2_plen_161_part_01